MMVKSNTGFARVAAIGLHVYILPRSTLPDQYVREAYVNRIWFDENKMLHLNFA